MCLTELCHPSDHARCASIYLGSLLSFHKSLTMTAVRNAAAQRLLQQSAMKVVLISTYELGHQPFGLASPAAWLRRGGAEVTCLDLSRQPFQENAVRAADVVAFYVPMHTATRLAIRLIEPIRLLNSRAHLCFYGLYAPVNEAYLRELGVETIVGGEFEAALTDLITQLAHKESDGNGPRATRSPAAEPRNPPIFLERLTFIPPDRSQLPPLRQYA